MSMEKKNRKFNIKFTVNELELIIRFLFTENKCISRKHLSAVQELFNLLSDKSLTNIRVKNRVNFIKRVLESKLTHKHSDKEITLIYCKNNDQEEEFVENEMRPLTDMYLSKNDIELVTNNLIGNRLKYGFLYIYSDELAEILSDFTSGQYESQAQIINDFKFLIGEIQREFRKGEMDDLNNSSFSFSDIDCAIKIKETVERLRSPSNTLLSGIQFLNQILGGGFEATRCYVFMGTSGGFKSGLLLSICYWCSIFNRDRVETNDPYKKPTVLYITQENTVDETLERIYNMVVSNNDIRDFTPDEVYKQLMDTGKFNIESENFIDIDIRYYPNKSISTDNIYDIVEDLNENGKEVIMIVHDYISRIRSRLNSSEPRIELGEVINDFKVIASHYNIPVITAMQLNRNAAMVIDSAMESNQADLARLLGRSNIGESWRVIENADVCIIINKEFSVTKQQYFLTFKRVKMRRREVSELSYFNHPFEIDNTMRLIPDIGSEPLSVTSLATDIVCGVVEEDTNAMSRNKICNNNDVDNELELKMIC